MRPFRLYVAAAALLAALCPAGLTAQRATSLGHAFQLAQQAQAAGDHAALRRHLEAGLAFSPAHPTLLYFLARAQSATGDTAAALATLERLATHGVARDVMADTGFARLREAPRFRRIATALADAAAPRVRSDTAFVLADRDFIPEGIAYDPADGAFYVGSLHRGGVLRLGRDGSASTFLPHGADGLGQVLGMRVDAARRRLWVATLVVDSAAPRFRAGIGGWAALHAYDLADGRRIARYPAPDSGGPHLLNDIAIAPSGDVYVTDSEGGALHRLPAGGGGLERVHRSEGDDFTYPNGVAVDSARGRLFVAHMEGITAFDLGAGGIGAPRRVTAPEGVHLGGIDGLYPCGQGLLAVQGMMDFQQITHLSVDDDGMAVTASAAPERRHPAHATATTGAIAEDALYYAANAQLRRLLPEGGISADPNAAPHVILRLPLAGACAADRR